MGSCRLLLRALPPPRTVFCDTQPAGCGVGSRSGRTCLAVSVVSALVLLRAGRWQAPARRWTPSLGYCRRLRLLRYFPRCAAGELPFLSPRRERKGDTRRGRKIKSARVGPGITSRVPPAEHKQKKPLGQCPGVARSMYVHTYIQPGSGTRLHAGDGCAPLPLEGCTASEGGCKGRRGTGTEECERPESASGRSLRYLSVVCGVWGRRRRQRASGRDWREPAEQWLPYGMSTAGERCLEKGSDVP